MRKAFHIFQRQIANLFLSIALFAKKIEENTQIVSVFQAGLTTCPRFNPNKIVFAKGGQFFQELGNLVNVLNITFGIIVVSFHIPIVAENRRFVNRIAEISRKVTGNFSEIPQRVGKIPQKHF